MKHIEHRHWNMYGAVLFFEYFYCIYLIIHSFVYCYVYCWIHFPVSFFPFLVISSLISSLLNKIYYVIVTKLKKISWLRFHIDTVTYSNIYLFIYLFNIPLLCLESIKVWMSFDWCVNRYSYCYVYCLFYVLRQWHEYSKGKTRWEKSKRN